MLAVSVSSSFPTKTRTAQSYYSRLCHQSASSRLEYKQQKPVAQQTSAFLGFTNTLRVPVNRRGKVMKGRGNAFSAVCYAAPLSTTNLQWVATISTAILMLARGTAIHKAFLVPLFTLQAPAILVSWIKGEYGIWTAFLGLLVRLFFFLPEFPALGWRFYGYFCCGFAYVVSTKLTEQVPSVHSSNVAADMYQGELELPFMALLLVIVAPYQVMNLRGKQEGVILSLIIAAYLAVQHFLRAGSLRKAIDQVSIIPSLAIICIVAVSGLLLI